MLTQKDERYKRNNIISIKVSDEPLVGTVLNAYKLRMTPEELEAQKRKNKIALDVLSQGNSEIYYKKTN